MAKREQFLVFGSPVIEEDEISAVVETLKTSWIGTGPKVAQFESQFAQFRKAPYAAAVNSCTAALHLSVLASGIEPGDEVITTPMSFCATVNAIIHAGAKPVLADVNARTLNIDPGAIEQKITPRTRAILPVHFAGNPCDMDAIMAIAKRHNLKVIEDCAHAVEAEYKGKPIGTFGDFGCFSFYATKNLTTGEGGMVLAKSEQDLSRIKMLALHGMSKDAWKRFGDDGFKHYQVVETGFKYNMMDLQAALGLVQLKKVERFWSRRKEIWQMYHEAFRNLPIELPTDGEPGSRHSYHLYTIRINKQTAGIDRDSFLNEMTKSKIGVGVHYLSIPEHPVYQEKLGWKAEDYPNAMKIGRETVSLPLSPKLTYADIQDVITATKRALGLDTQC